MPLIMLKPLIKVLAAVFGDFQNVIGLFHFDNSGNINGNFPVVDSVNNIAFATTNSIGAGSNNPFGDDWSWGFDGSGYATTSAGNTGLNLTGDFTVEGWAYPTAYAGPSSGSVIFELGTYASGILLRLSSDSAYNSWYVNGTSYVSPTGYFPLNTWTHFAISRSGNTTKLFINGSRVALITASIGTVCTTGGINIGTARHTTGQNFTGNISNLRIINGVCLYPNDTYTVPTAPQPATAETVIRLASSGMIVDSSNSNIALNILGGVSSDRFVPFTEATTYSPTVNSGSVYFPGDAYLSTAGNANLTLGSGDFTIEGYFNLQGPGLTYGYQLLGPNTGQGSSGWAVVLNRQTSTYGIGFVLANSWVCYSTTLLKQNMWYHFAVVRSGTGTNNLKIYLNGVVVAQATNTATDSYTTTTFRVGSDGNNGSIFNGYFADFRFTKGRAVYTAPFAPSTAKLGAVANTTCLINFTNTGIIDQATKTNLVSVGSPIIDTSVKKFGGGALKVSPSNYVKGHGNGSYQFGTGNFTIEFWMNPSVAWSSQAASAAVLGQRTNGTVGGWLVYREPTTNPTKMTFIIGATATGIVQLATSSVPANGVWTHWAIVRNGNTLSWYCNGVLDSSTTIGSAITAADTTAQFMIGYSASTSASYNGYIDDIRISKGIARYTANFTVPSAAYLDY